MTLLKQLDINSEKTFNSALGVIIREGRYKGMLVDLDSFVQEGKSRLWKVSVGNQQTMDKLSGVGHTGDKHPQSKSIDLMMAEYYVQKHQQCITRGISFELSLSDLKKLYAKKTCYYSGERVELSPTGSSRNAWTLDRKDNSKGYTRDNVVVCAKWVNGLKNELFEKPDGIFRTNLKTLGKILSKIK